MAEKRKDASSSRGNEELSGRRRGPGGGLEPRTHVPAVGEHTARARRLGESSAGVEAHPGNSRGRLSNRAKEACCARAYDFSALHYTVNAILKFT